MVFYVSRGGHIVTGQEIYEALAQAPSGAGMLADLLMNGNDIIMDGGVIYGNLLATGNELFSTATGWDWKVPVGGIFEFFIAGAVEYTFTNTTLDMGQNILSNFALLQGITATNQIDDTTAGWIYEVGNTHTHRFAINGTNEFEILGDFVNVFTNYIQLGERTDPTQTANTVKLYAKDKAGTSELFYINDAGTVRDLSVTGGGGSPHNLLDGVQNQDTVAQTVSRGSLIYGNATPLWDELNIGATRTHLQSDGVDVSWGTGDLDFGGTPATAGALRLSNTQLVTWRNAGNTLNFTFGVNASDRFEFISGIASLLTISSSEVRVEPAVNFNLGGNNMILDSDGNSRFFVANDQLDIETGGAGRVSIRNTGMLMLSNLDLDAWRLIIDLDADTHMQANGDDRIDFTIGNILRFYANNTRINIEPAYEIFLNGNKIWLNGGTNSIRANAGHETFFEANSTEWLKFTSTALEPVSDTTGMIGNITKRYTNVFTLMVGRGTTEQVSFAANQTNVLSNDTTGVINFTTRSTGVKMFIDTIPRLNVDMDMQENDILNMGPDTINSETTIGTTDPANDFLLIYDASLNVLRKVTPNNLGIAGGGGNSISQGDSDVTVSDVGAGVINFTVDGTLRASINASTTSIFNNLSTTGNNTFGDTSADLITFNARANTSLHPSSNNTIALGQSGNSWLTIWARDYVLDLTGSVTSVTTSQISASTTEIIYQAVTGDHHTFYENTTAKFRIENDGTLQWMESGRQHRIDVQSIAIQIMAEVASDTIEFFNGTARAFPTLEMDDTQAVWNTSSTTAVGGYTMGFTLKHTAPETVDPTPIATFAYSGNDSIDVLTVYAQELITLWEATNGNEAAKVAWSITVNGTLQTILDLDTNGAAGQERRIGFFGVTPAERQLVTTSATTAQIVTALQNLGLFRAT